ncbi:hypothetical protein BDZ91DRAFT_778561 [Kalaharituber pfeilii]|nr:hypothetical protein BDZ91DRAFT_778561 [Kalaharituber pfeilii]
MLPLIGKGITTSAFSLLLLFFFGTIFLYIGSLLLGGQKSIPLFLRRRIRGKQNTSLEYEKDEKGQTIASHASSADNKHTSRSTGFSRVNSAEREVPGYPLGFIPKSKEEREHIGKYPDYAELSGVPWPHLYHNFDPLRAIPRPYRPFRWTYHQTMSLSRMETDWWLEVESTYKERVAQRKELYRLNGRKILDWLPGEDVQVACRETMELVVMWLVRRYPQCFELVGDTETQDGKIFVNHLLGTQTPLDRGMHPLMVLLEHVPEDFAIMLPTITPTKDPTNPTVTYTFRAGVICSSIGWSLETKLGLCLHDIHHTTGNVPDYAAKMSFSMDRFFSKNLPPKKPIQRGSWSFEIGQPLFILPGDEHHRTVRSFQNPNVSVQDIYLRVDWQTLRRLPISGAVLFNYKAVFTPMDQLREEPNIPALLVKILTEGKKELLKYKGTWHVEHVIIPTLTAWATEQVDNGIVENDWEVLV